MNQKDLTILHKYFVSSNFMRHNFDQYLRSQKKLNLDSKEGFESVIFLSYWYSGLYVVVEGWRDLKFSDNVIDSLLLSPNIDKLRLFRNSTFHFQKEYVSKKALPFLEGGFEIVEWVRNLNSELGRFFLEKFEGEKTS